VTKHRAPLHRRPGSDSLCRGLELVPGVDHVRRVVDAFVESLDRIRRAVRKMFGRNARKALTGMTREPESSGILESC